MPDLLDKAQATEELFRDQALQRQRQNAAQEHLDSKDCKDCGERIPKARRDVGGINRCIDCQQDLERP